MEHIEVGQVWRHKKKRSLYHLDEIKGDLVHLTAMTKGSRSTWKADCLLRWDYELVKQDGKPS